MQIATVDLGGGTARAPGSGARLGTNGTRGSTARSGKQRCLFSVAGRIRIVPAGRGIIVRMVVGPGCRRSNRRRADRGARANSDGMSIPGAMPCAAPCAAVVTGAADEAAAAIAARGEPVDEERSGSRRLRQTSFEHRHVESQFVAVQLRRL